MSLDAKESLDLVVSPASLAVKDLMDVPVNPAPLGHQDSMGYVENPAHLASMVYLDSQVRIIVAIETKKSSIKEYTYIQEE